MNPRSDLDPVSAESAVMNSASARSCEDTADRAAWSPARSSCCAARGSGCKPAPANSRGGILQPNLSFVLAYAIGPALGSQLIRLEDRCPRDSASGAAQPGLYRLDVGPRVSMQVRKNFRVHFDYRQRLAGNTLPRSGPAITLAADF